MGGPYSRASTLNDLAARVQGWAGASSDGAKVRMLAAALRDLAAAQE